MSLIARAALSLFSLYREAVAAGDLEAMERIGAAAEAMEDSASDDLSSMLGDPPARPGELPAAMPSDEGEPEKTVIPEARRLAHPAESGIVIGTIFVPSSRVTVLPASRRRAGLSIQRQRSERPSKLAAKQRAAKWVAEDRK